MNCIDQFSPTPEMTEFFKFAQDDLIHKCEELFAAGLRAHETIVQLPHENADGTKVKHGANNEMRNLMNSYAQAACALSLEIGDRDIADLIRYKNRFVGGAYISIEIFNTEYQHLLRDIERIEGKRVSE